MKCMACGKQFTKKALSTPFVNNDGRTITGVHQCPKCGAVQGTCYLGDSYSIVLPYMTRQDPPMERVRYFDFKTLGSEGIGRRHGWYDTETRLVVQAG